MQIGIRCSTSLLDLVVWLDVCNEFPLPVWTPNVFADIFGVPESDAPVADHDLTAMMLPLLQPWPQSAVDRFGEYLTETIAGLKAAYPTLNYTFSFASFGSENVIERVDTSALDLLEPHIWTTDDMQWAEESGMWSSQQGDPRETLPAFVKQAMTFYPACRDRCRAILDQQTDRWSALATRNDVPLVTTEAWTMVLYEDISPDGSAGEWDWFKEIAEIGVELAIEKGWQDICTSNFCEPHFEGMWQDVDWHQRLTKMIRG